MTSSTGIAPSMAITGARHDLVHMTPLERIHAIFAVHVPPTTRDLLREDRARHHDHREPVRHRAREQRRQKRIHVVREPKRKHHAP